MGRTRLGDRMDQAVDTTGTLERLAATIRARRHESSETSYTRQLLDAGPQRCAKKFGEEAVETALAAVSQGSDELTAEAADTLYHLLVLLESRSVAIGDVLALLESRMGTSGLVEKAARGPVGS
jgi:phosphoribosyl-ATP pyrophosphohydrolase